MSRGKPHWQGLMHIKRILPYKMCRGELNNLPLSRFRMGTLCTLYKTREHLAWLLLWFLCLCCKCLFTPGAGWVLWAISRCAAWLLSSQGRDGEKRRFPWAISLNYCHIKYAAGYMDLQSDVERRVVFPCGCWMFCWTNAVLSQAAGRIWVLTVNGLEVSQENTWR